MELSDGPETRTPTTTRPEPHRTRVGLFADQYLVGQAVRTALTAKGFIVMHYRWPSGQRQITEAAQQLGESGATVGLLLCDLDRPGRVKEVVDLVAAAPARWLLLSYLPEGPRWGAVLEGGVSAVLPISTRLDDLAVALHALSRRRVVMDEVMRRRVVAQWRLAALEEQGLLNRMKSLTAREMEVLTLLNDGRTVRGIAELAGVSETTVRSQVKAILRKLEVSSQLAAVAAYRRMQDASVGSVDGN